MIQTKFLVIGGGTLLIAVILFLVTKWKKKYDKKRELKIHAEDRLREEMLDHVILNAEDRGGEKTESVPYDVDYSKHTLNLSKEKRIDHMSETMIQLTEHSELSSRKHVLNPRQVIRIGSGINRNDIVVQHIDEVQCEIFLYRAQIWIRNLGMREQVILKRKKKKAYITRNGVQLYSGDVIILGDIYIDVIIIPG